MRVIKNRTCSLTVIASEPLVVLRMSISHLHALENHHCHAALVAAIIKIINDRLYHSNETILTKVHEKKRKNKQLLFALFSLLVLILFVSELGFALYYALNRSVFCNELNSFPAVNPKI
ncbi:MAG: hypothetical protein ACRCXC_07990 [Legionella sp.]